MESGFYGFKTLKLKTMIIEENKDLDYWKKNAEEDYMQVPISVLRYISELEQVVKNCSIPAVVGQSEQLVCPYCKGKNIEIRHREQSFRCIDCKEGWAN